jgi:hypothetical protein
VIPKASYLVDIHEESYTVWAGKDLEVLPDPGPTEKPILKRWEWVGSQVYSRASILRRLCGGTIASKPHLGELRYTKWLL